MLSIDVLKRASIVGLGVGAGPLVQLLATPFLARMYTPLDFGHLALFLSVVSVLTTISCLRYEAAITVVEDVNIKTIALVALASVLLLFILLSVLTGSGIPQAIYPPFAALGDYNRAVPVAAACGGVVLVGSYLTLRQGRYLRNAAIRASQTTLFVLIALFSSGIGLVKANIISALVVGSLVFAYLMKVLLPVTANSLRSIAVRYRQYPLLLAPTSLLDAFALALPVFFISSSYGLDATGNYTQIQRLIGAPMLLGGVVVGQLFLKRSGELFRAGVSSQRLLWKCVAFLCMGAMVLLTTIWLVGEPLCQLILGKAWRVDMPFLLLTISPFLFKSIVSPVSTVFLTHHQVRRGVKWQIGYFLTTTSVLYLASTSLPFEHFLMVYAAHEAILYSIYLMMANRVSYDARLKNKA